MKQLIVNPSDTIQVLTGHSEENEVHSFSSHIAECFSKCIDSCSQRILESNWLDGVNIVIALLAIIFAVSICKPKVKVMLFRHLKIQAFLIWVCGVILYMVGFNEHGSAASNVALLLRSSLSSMEMFVSHSDLIEVNEKFHGNPTYMALFALTHFCAVAISAIFILRLFGFRLVSWVKVMKAYICSWLPLNCNYYVMFGVNSNTLMLANSIHKKRKEEKQRIIFINMPEKGHSHAATRFSFSHFFHSDSNGIDKYLEDIEMMGALLFNSSRSFDNPILKHSIDDVFKVFQALDFSWIVRMPLQNLLRNSATRKNKKFNGSKVEFFFLSDEEKDNLIAVTVLQKIQKKQIGYKNFSFNCYCHARKSQNNAAMLNEGALAFKVHIIDTSNLAVLDLKRDNRYHPVNFVEKDTNTGTVKSAFTGMVIGFGETGRDAFRFLYEFSSFTKDNQGNPSAKKIHVIDKDIDDLKAEFLEEAPALKNNSEIEWWNVKSTHSAGYWDKLKSVIQELNYIVISVKDDEEAVDIATSIFEYAYRYRENLNRFKIFVRLRKSMREDFLCMHKEFFDIIIPFGSVKKAFSYDVINMDVLEKSAKQFKYRYDIVCNKRTYVPSVDDEENAADAWLNRRQTYLNETDRLKRKENEIKVWYQEEQDRSNAWHVYTKVALAKDGITLETLLLDSNKQLLHNLCDCEHLRWNAKMELLGFVAAKEEDTLLLEDKPNGNLRGAWKNFRLRRHECIVDCQTLHSKPVLANTIQYDESTVRLSFEMKDEIRTRNYNNQY